LGLKDAEKQVDRAFTRDSYTGQSFENAFGGATSFLRLKYTKELNNVDLAITGIPFDQAVTNRPGSRFGPRAIREASTLQPFDPIYGWGDFDPMSEISMVDYGDIAYDYAKVSEFPQILEDHVSTILDKCSGCISLGGDHFISYPILKAYRKKFGKPLALLQFDAHSDTWPDDDMHRIDHGTMFYKAVKQGLVQVRLRKK
jgi:agmatinase